MVKEYTLLKERIKIYFGSQQKFAEYLRMNPKTLSFKLKEKGRFTQMKRLTYFCRSMRQR